MARGSFSLRDTSSLVIWGGVSLWDGTGVSAGESGGRMDVK